MAEEFDYELVVVARSNGSTRPAAACRCDGAAVGSSALASSDHPGDRRPQWAHRRKIVPG
jgi:hypothetical protein